MDRSAGSRRRPPSFECTTRRSSILGSRHDAIRSAAPLRSSRLLRSSPARNRSPRSCSGSPASISGRSMDIRSRTLRKGESKLESDLLRATAPVQSKAPTLQKPKCRRGPGRDPSGIERGRKVWWTLLWRFGGRGFPPWLCGFLSKAPKFRGAKAPEDRIAGRSMLRRSTSCADATRDPGPRSLPPAFLSPRMRRAPLSKIVRRPSCSRSGRPWRPRTARSSRPRGTPRPGRRASGTRADSPC